MTTLQNYPNLNQRVVPINGENDCVPTSLADGLEYLTNKHYNVYDIVTAGYGPNYRGFTSAKTFIPFCASQGVKLFPIDGDSATLVKALHQQIQALHPCLLTEPDVYAPLHPDWSHVLSVYREDPGTITARDPYSTKDVTHTDAEWERLLEFREIWTLERMETLGVPANWHDDGTTLTAPNGIPVRFGFRSHVLANHWDANNWPLEVERTTDQLEGSNPSLGKGSQQTFRWKMLGYTVERGVFEEWTGQELVFARSQIFKYYTLAVQMRDTALKLEADNAKLQADLQALPQS